MKTKVALAVALALGLAACDKSVDQDAIKIGNAMAVAGDKLSQSGEKMKHDAAKIEIGQLSQTLDLFKIEVGRYPTQQEGLQALITEPPRVSDWHGPYWKTGDVPPKDPWGNDYVYIFPGQHGPFDIISHGDDGKDITSWQ